VVSMDLIPGESRPVILLMFLRDNFHSVAYL
jgi:hypothetical protein